MSTTRSGGTVSEYAVKPRMSVNSTVESRRSELATRMPIIDCAPAPRAASAAPRDTNLRMCDSVRRPRIISLTRVPRRWMSPSTGSPVTDTSRLAEHLDAARIGS